ncbi:hypothetical protein [Candidatus Halobonum tyrrellensis]|uniref:Uncharacterized protein n=1 Tax=Candidatus Halobonum tyrrellensis G22 TaxID=1324957 RepID=V4GP62_9EURY|nr:hypothetical protein [Candidatus Halobonum tyrrellensis]ESP87186.1 hypothetical protein K933_15014 [Candidatus Halobonum tyrrellensis G22]
MTVTEEVEERGETVKEEIEEHTVELEFLDEGSGYVSRLKQWLLISGSRRTIIAALLVVVFCAFVAMSFVWSDFAEMLSPNTESNLSTLFTRLLSGVILLVSIVTSVNSLSISQELTPVGEQHDRVVKSWDFRERAAEITEQSVSPPVPGEFLKAIIEQVENDLKAFKAEADDNLDGQAESDAEEVREEVSDYLDGIRDGLERTRDVVSNPQNAAVNVAMFGSSYDVSEYVNSVRELQAEHGSTLGDDEASEQLDRIVDSLQYFISAREYFKTVYYKREFSYLSRDLLYSGLPAILVLSYVIVGLPMGAEAFPNGPIYAQINLMTLCMAFVYTMGLAPFLVLTAYTLRAAVIAQKTVSEGAFTLN